MKRALLTTIILAGCASPTPTTQTLSIEERIAQCESIDKAEKASEAMATLSFMSSPQKGGIAGFGATLNEAASHAKRKANFDTQRRGLKCDEL